MIDFKPSINFGTILKATKLPGCGYFWDLGVRCNWCVPLFCNWYSGDLGGCANSLFSWLSSGRMGDFNSQGLISYALWPFIALIVGIFLSQRVNNPRLMLVPALLWLVLDTHIMLFQSLIQYLGDLDYLPYIFYVYIPTLFVMLFVWQSLAVVWVISRIKMAVVGTGTDYAGHPVYFGGVADFGERSANLESRRNSTKFC